MMSRKRQRDAVKGRIAKAETFVNSSRDQRSSAEGSRLKKAKTLGDEEVPVGTTHDSPTGAESKDLDEKISHVRCRIDTFLQRSIERHQFVRPEFDLLVSIHDVLQAVPVPVLMSKLGKIPRVLLIAVRKGINDYSVPPRSGLTVLSRSLVILAKGSIVSVPGDDRGIRVRRSAFQSKGQSVLNRMELEAMSRAGKWALHLLADTVRGNGDVNVGGKFVNENKVLRHGDISNVFVSPRDTLDAAMSSYYADNIIEQINRLVRNPCISALEKIRVIWLTCFKLRRVIKVQSLLPIVEAVALVAVKIELPMETPGTNGPVDVLPSDFVHHVMGGSGNCVFSSMSAEAKSALLRVSRIAWLNQVRAVQIRFCEGYVHSSQEELEAVRVLAAAAVENIDLHWELMDEVRRVVSSRLEPFSARLWQHHAFYRAVLSATAEMIARRLELYAMQTCTPLCWRFPGQFQSLIKGISILTHSLTYGPPEGIRNINAGPVGIAMIYNELRLNLSLNISPNAHAFLLCWEGVIEKFFWASGFFAASSFENNDRHATNGAELFKMICALVAVVEVIRLPGGTWAESEEVVGKRMSATYNFLMDLLVQIKLPSQRTEEWRLNGLLAMVTCGIACGSSVRGLRKFCVILDKEEQRELWRATELSLQLSRGELAHAKALKAHRDVSQCVKPRIRTE